jgi:hypothetical protein
MSTAAMNSLLLRIAADHADRPEAAAALCDAVRLLALGLVDAMRPPATRIDAIGACAAVAHQARIARDEYQRRADSPVTARDLALCELVEA